MLSSSTRLRASVAAVECKREDTATGKSSVERRYFISSLRGTDAKAMAQERALRGSKAAHRRITFGVYFYSAPGE